MIDYHAVEEMAGGLLLVIFFLWAAVTIGAGFGTKRHKNHHVRLRAKASRRMKRAVLQ